MPARDGNNFFAPIALLSVAILTQSHLQRAAEWEGRENVAKWILRAANRVCVTVSQEGGILMAAEPEGRKQELSHMQASTTTGHQREKERRTHQQKCCPHLQHLWTWFFDSNTEMTVITRCREPRAIIKGNIPASQKRHLSTTASSYRSDHDVRAHKATLRGLWTLRHKCALGADGWSKSPERAAARNTSHPFAQRTDLHLVR